MLLTLNIITLVTTILVALYARRTAKLTDDLFTASKNSAEILANEQDRQNNMITHVDNRVSELALESSKQGKQLDTVEFYQRELENVVVYKKSSKKKATQRPLNAVRR